MRLLRRLGWSAVTVWAVVSLAFVVNNLLPGDPARMVAGPQARPADVARIREGLGLDRPLAVQYARFWARLAHLGPRRGGAGHDTCATLAAVGDRALHVDFGKSFQLHQPVVEIIATRVPRTLALAVSGISIQLAFGLAAGTVAAVRRGSWLDRAMVGASLLGVSAPAFLSALLLQYALAYRLRLLPLDGFGVTLGDHARGLALPALTLGTYGAAYTTRLVRDEVSGLLRQDWVRTARAKGLTPARVVVRHVLRDALVTVTTAVALDFGALMGGALVVETVFRWPGIGELSVQAAMDRDGPVVIACVVVTAIAIVASNFAADLLCAWLDPRLR